MIARLSRRVLLAAAGASMFTAGALAQGFPSKPVTLIVPWPAGGGSDTIMRMIAEPMGKSLGQPVVVVNKPGAGGQIGLRETAESAPDGHTISFIATGFIAQQYNVQNALVVDDFAYLAWVGVDAGALTTNAKTGWKSIDDLVKAAKEKPGTIRNGNDQPGGTSFLTVALMERALGIKLVRIPYAGDAPNMQALLSGEVQTSSASITNFIDHHKAGTVRILATSGAARDPKVPDVPTFKELKYDVVAGTMRAVVAPKRIAPDVAAKLQAALQAALKDEAFLKRATDLSFGIAPAFGADATKLVKNMDAQLYPILLEADMVKFNKK